MYPSITGESNIAANTQVGKIEIPHKVYKNENAYNIDGYSRSGEFVENKVTDNIIEFCHRWFHLGTVQDLIKEVDKKMIDSKGYPVYKVSKPIRVSYRERYKHPIRFISEPRKNTSYIIEYNNEHRKAKL